jgi:hypothetical protein
MEVGDAFPYPSPTFKTMPPKSYTSTLPPTRLNLEARQHFDSDERKTLSTYHATLGRSWTFYEVGMHDLCTYNLLSNFVDPFFRTLAGVYNHYPPPLLFDVIDKFRAAIESINFVELACFESAANYFREYLEDAGANGMISLAAESLNRHGLAYGAVVVAANALLCLASSRLDDAITWMRSYIAEFESSSEAGDVPPGKTK